MRKMFRNDNELLTHVMFAYGKDFERTAKALLRDFDVPIQHDDLVNEFIINVPKIYKSLDEYVKSERAILLYKCKNFMRNTIRHYCTKKYTVVNQSILLDEKYTQHVKVESCESNTFNWKVLNKKQRDIAKLYFVKKEPAYIVRVKFGLTRTELNTEIDRIVSKVHRDYLNQIN